MFAVTEIESETSSKESIEKKKQSQRIVEEIQIKIY